MEYVLKAVRNALIADTTLLTMVDEDDIHVSHIKELRNYPCVTMNVSSTRSASTVSGIESGMIDIEARATTSKLDAWEIASQIKTLLDEQELAVTDADRVFHLIKEISTSDDVYDLYGNVWVIKMRFSIMYSKVSDNILVATSASGIIYAHETAVTAAAANEVAKFRGVVQLTIEFECEMRRTRNRFPKTGVYRIGQASLKIGEVMLK